MNTIKDCKNTQPLLASFVDNELSHAETGRVRAHLSGCAVCQSIVDDFAATARLISTLPTVAGPSADFEARLARRIADESLAPKPSVFGKLRSWWGGITIAPVTQFAPAFAAVLVVLIPAGYLFTGRNAAKPSGVTIASPPASAASLVASDPTLAELFNEHTAFSATQPLSDPAQSATDGFAPMEAEN